MTTIVNYTEQQQVKPISDNNAERFDQIMVETEVKDLQPLLGMSLYQDLIQDPTSAKYVTLKDGATWTLSGKSYKMMGLKYVLAYLFYANYVEQVATVDTFSGMVQHTFAEAKRAESSEIRRIASMNREIAARYWEEVKLYIENNLSTYPEYKMDGTAVFNPKIDRLDMVDTGYETRCEVNGKRYIKY